MVINTLFFDDLPSSDYRPMPALDRYDNEDLDDVNYDPMSVEDRVAAEQELRRRDRDEGRVRRDDRGLLYGKIAALFIIIIFLSCPHPIIWDQRYILIHVE